MSGGETIISLENVFKIFGPNPRGRAFDLAKSGVHKDEVQKQSGHVVGLTDKWKSNCRRYRCAGIERLDTSGISA